MSSFRYIRLSDIMTSWDIRFWWNNCISVPAILDNIFEEIYCYFKDQMLPEKEEPEMDLLINVNQLEIPGAGKKEKELKVAEL